MTRALCGVTLAAQVILAATPGAAQSTEEFYAATPLRVIIGYSPGGGYDSYARLLAGTIGDYLPGHPEVIVENLPGAGSVTLANRIANGLPADGSVIAAVSRGIPVEPLLGLNPTRFEARDMTWIGSMTDEVSVCVASDASGLEAFAPVIDGGEEYIVGGTGAASDNETFPRMMAKLLGADIRIISGYPGSAEVSLAMEQGEIDGFCGSWSSFVATRGDLLESGEINVLVVLGDTDMPELSDVPRLSEFAETEEQRRVLDLVLSRLQISRPYIAPPDMPRDRVDALRSAFMKAANDPDLRAEAARMGLEMNPMDGEAVAELIDRIYDTPEAVLENARDILAVR